MNVHSASTESEVTAKADASRTLACVNACQGIPTADLLSIRTFALNVVEERDALAKALSGLVAMKDYKDANGKTEYYKALQPIAWDRARVALGKAQTVASKE